MASSRGRSNSPKPLGNQDVEMRGSNSPQSKLAHANGTKPAKPSRDSSSDYRSRSGSSPADRSVSRSHSRSMSLSRSGSVTHSRSGSDSRSPSPRRRRGRSYSDSRSRSRSYSSYSSRSDSRSSSGSGSRVIEVLKLTKHVTPQHLYEIFGVYGTIKDVDLPIVKRLGSHLGEAVLTYESSRAAQKAITHMDRGQLDGSLITVRVHRPPSPPRGPAALRRGGNGYRAGPSDRGNRYGSGRAPPPARRNQSPPRRSFGGRSRSPPRRNFGGDSRAPPSRLNRSRSPAYRRRRSPTRSLSRSPRRGTRRTSPQYGGRRSPPRNSRRKRSYSRSSTSSYSRSSRSRSVTPRK